MEATHKIVEGYTNRKLANAALKAMALIEECEQGTIKNPYNLASSVLADNRTLIQAIYEDGYIRYNDDWFIVEVDEYSLYVDITGFAHREMGYPEYKMNDNTNN